MPDSNKIPALPSYNVVQALLDEMGITTKAAEVHGQLCGMLSSGIFDKATVYIQELIDNVDLMAFEKEIKQLISLVDISLKQLTSATFEFHLLLPDDEAPLQDRAQALSMWCQGYSDALLNSDVNIDSLAHDEVKEAFFHISEIATIDHTYSTVTEEDEVAYTEVYEYVRMAAMMLYAEIDAAGGDKSSAEVSEDQDRTLH
jgi:hypothetical protein